MRLVDGRQGISRGHAQTHARGEEKTAEPGDLVVVHLALVGHVVEAAAATEIEQKRHKKMGGEETHDESKKEQYEFEGGHDQRKCF